MKAAKLRTVALLVTLVLTFACSQKNDARRQAEDEIRDVVLQWQLARYGFLESLPFPSDSVYVYVGVKPADPSEDFMARLLDYVPPVRKFSSGVTASNGECRDKLTGEKARLIGITDITWISDSLVMVAARCRVSGLSSPTFYHSVRRVGQAWRVTKVTRDCALEWQRNER